MKYRVAEFVRENIITACQGKIKLGIKSGKLQPGEEPDRAILWKKARKRKDGEEVDEDLAKICDKIDKLWNKRRRVN